MFNSQTSKKLFNSYFKHRVLNEDSPNVVCIVPQGDNLNLSMVNKQIFLEGISKLLDQKNLPPFVVYFRDTVPLAVFRNLNNLSGLTYESLKTYANIKVDTFMSLYYIKEQDVLFYTLKDMTNQDLFIGLKFYNPTKEDFLSIFGVF
jgi:hypothetical protein